jgi:serine protease AprX
MTGAFIGLEISRPRNKHNSMGSESIRIRFVRATRTELTLDTALHTDRIWNTARTELGQALPARPSVGRSRTTSPRRRPTCHDRFGTAHTKPARFAWLRDLATPQVRNAPQVAACDLSPGSMYHVVDQIGARDLWNQGITGAGVNVAVIDTGVANVPALSTPGKIVAVADLSCEAADPATAFVDNYGHGTAMAGIIAGVEPGADPATAADHPERFLGVAPGAGIVSVKVSGRDGSSHPADVAAGIDWVVANADELNIRVISLSYDSSSTLGYLIDPLTAAVERAWHAGIVVVTIAGNGGNDSTRLASPGIDPYAIAVASADFSADGVTIGEWSNGSDGIRRPDIAAPGGHIESLRAPGSLADLDHSDLGDVARDPMLFKGTGTSQSAAVVAGVAALLIEQHPDITPDQVKAAIVSTGSRIDGSGDAAGADLVCADRAARAELTSDVQTWARAVVGTPQNVDRVASNNLTDAWGGAHWGGAHWGGAHWGGAHWGGAHWGGGKCCG